MTEEGKKSTKDSVVEVSVQTSSHKASDALLMSLMNGVEIPKDTRFELYQHKKRKLDDIVLHGENNNLIYDGSRKTDPKLSGTPEYCIGLYDPQERKLKLIHTELVPSKIISKNFLNAKDNYEDSSKITKLEQRSRLGEEFGTRRAKSALSSFKKNRIDATKLANNELDIAAEIQKATASIPDKDKLTKIVEEENRLIPPYNKDATRVEDVYPLGGIIPERELGLIKVDVFLQQLEDKVAASKMLELMPYHTENSQYLVDKLGSLSSKSDNVKQTLQILYYISVLMGVYFNARSRFVDKLTESFPNPPSTMIIDSCLKRFSDYKGYRRRFYIDPMNEDRLLCSILALMLRIDDYTLPIQPLAQELSIKPSRLSSLFRSMGCHNKNATNAEKEAFGVPKTTSSYKIAVLRVPLKLPPMTRRGRRPQGNQH